MSITLLNKSSICTTTKLTNSTGIDTSSNNSCKNSSSNLFSNNNKKHAHNNLIQYKPSNHIKHSYQDFKDIHNQLKQHNYFSTCTDMFKCHNRYCVKCNKSRWYQEQYVLNKVSDQPQIKQILEMTLDSSHYLNNDSSLLLDSLNKCKIDLFRSRLMKNFKKDIGIDSISCNLDFTYSLKYGYHYHYHCIINLTKEISEIKLQSIRNDIVAKWQYLLSKYFYKAFGEQHHISSSSNIRKYAVEIKRVTDIKHMSYYVTKSIGYDTKSYIHEATNHFNKTGRTSSSYTLMDLYKNLINGGSEQLSYSKTDSILKTFFKSVESKRISSWYLKSDSTTKVIKQTQNKLKKEHKKWVEQNYKKSVNKVEIEYINTVRNECKNKQILEVINKFITSFNMHKIPSNQRVNDTNCTNIQTNKKTGLRVIKALNKQYYNSSSIVDSIKVVRNQSMKSFEACLINSS